MGIIYSPIINRINYVLCSKNEKKEKERNKDILEKPGNKKKRQKRNTCDVAKKIKRTISSNTII